MSDPSLEPPRAARRAARRRRVARRRVGLLAAAAAAFIAGAVLGSAGSGGGPPSAAGEERGGGKGEGRGEREPPPRVTGFDGPVPILMYHGIGSPPNGAALPDLFVPVPELREQVRWLADVGYNAVTLDDVHAAWTRGAPIARNPVVLSFDDGLRSQYVGALPVLAELGWPGVLNLKLESLEQGELTDEMVTGMIAAGWAIDSHTITHADVAALDGEALRREVAGSRRELRRRFGVPVRFFTYPAGSYDDEAIAAVERAGYAGATTTEFGLASPAEPYTLRRIRIDGGDGAEGLRAKLASAGADGD